jgi:hypothetical protein
MIKKMLNKKNIRLAIVVLALVLILSIIYFVDLIKFNSKLKKYDEKYMFGITYLIADREQVDENLTVSETLNEHEDAVMYSTSYAIPLKKDGDFLYADLSEFANKIVLEHTTDIIFSHNNVDGEVIDDCSYDKKTHIIKVPYSYYKGLEDKYEDGPVQMEIESLLTNKEIENIKVDYSIKKLVTYENTATNELYSLDTQIPLSNYINGKVNKKNINVYLNGSSKAIDTEYIGYDNNSKTLTIDMPVILVNRVDIKVGNNIFTNVFAATIQDLGNSSSYFKLKSKPTSLITNRSYLTKVYNLTPKTATNKSGKQYTYIPFHKTGLSSCYTTGKISGSSVCKKKKISGQTNWTVRNLGVVKYNLVWEYGKKSGKKGYWKGTSPASGIWPYVIYANALGTNKSGTKMLDFENSGWYIPIPCTEHSSSSSKNTKKLGMKVTIQYDGTKSGKNWLVLKAYTVNSKGKKAYSNTQYGAVYLKVAWTDTACNLTVNKRVSTSEDTEDTGVATIGLYNDSSCTNMVTSKTINVDLKNNSSGTATFDNLSPNKTYYIKEMSFVSGNTSLLGTSYVPTIGGNVINCHPFTVTDSNADKTCDNPIEITNTENKYCYAIKKVDKENHNITIDHTTWRLIGVEDGAVYNASTTNGIAMFTNLKYQNYRLKEITANPASLDNDSIPDYWNDNNQEVIVQASSLTVGDSCSANAVEKTDTKVYYCIKVKKVAASTKEPLKGAKFVATMGNITIDSTSTNYHYNDSDGIGITSFFIGDSSKVGTYTITETEAPEGYTINPASKYVTAVALKETANEAEARRECFKENAMSSDGTTTIASLTYDNSTDDYVIEDYEYLINWYKTTENGTTLVNGAEFKVKDSNGNYIKVKAPTSQKDLLNVEKACYQYDGTDSTGTVMTSGAAGSTNIDMTGQVCIGNLPAGTYTVIETKAPQYHTFGAISTKDILASTKFANMSGNNKFINQPTEFKFKKRVADTDGSQEDNVKYTVTIGGVTKTVSLSEMTTAELQKIAFTVYDSNGNAVSLKEISSGYYEYGSNSVDQVGSGNNTVILHLDSNREIYIKHLPKGDYTIKEVDTSSCLLENGGFGTIANPSSRPASAATCANGRVAGGECIGYYMPDYSTNSYSFTIDDCSSEIASQNTKSCTSESGMVIKELTNIPTEIIFTKKDLYGYGDQADIIDNNREQNSTESTVEFENAKERSDFDRIDFKVKDSSGHYLNFVYIGNSSDTCTSDSDYSIYKYIPGLELPAGVDPNVFNYHTSNGGLTITQTLHACGGHIKLVNLCRGETYTFEEIKVPDDSVYVLEQVGALNPTVCFEIPCSTNDEEQRTSTTAVINDKPTRVTFEKRDGKYNYLIPDETTTFEVYRCPKDNGENTNCNPSSYATVEEREAVGMKLIKFEPRGVITGDEEDSGLEVYRMMSDSDAANKELCTDNQSTNCYVTSVHPISGKLVLRYLQSGYNYVLLETVAPKNYILPKGKVRETPFTVINTTVAVEQIDVPNKPSAIIIKKYADLDGDGQADSDKFIGGAKFKIYKVTNYNANQKPQDQEKELLTLKTVKDGIYENRPVLDTDIVTTCTGTGCSYDPKSLGYDNSILEDIDELISTSDPSGVEMLKPGTAIIQYLEYDTYYVIEEVEASKGYTLPENDDDRFTLVHLEKNGNSIVDTEMNLVNKPSSFTFYKFDEFNSPLDGATFYLQKLDQDKKYNTLTVSEEELVTGETIYKADPTSELQEIHTVGGKATVYYLEPGQYRILEVEAAEGYELPKKTINVATFFVDDDGLVYGNNIITNKKPQETIEYLADAKAELIISIQTGKTVIKYGLIITLLIGSIVGLIILLKKRK